MGRFTLILTGLLFVGSWCAPASAAVMYHLTDLGTLGGNTSYAGGINNGGQVVGYSFSATDGANARAFLYSNGVLTDLGQPFGGDTHAFRINDNSQIVGEGDSSTQAHGFIYHYVMGSLTDLRPLGIRAANGINSLGQAVGKNTSGHAVFYSGGTATDLGTLGGSVSQANEINDAGLIVGESETGGVDVFGTPVTHAVLYKNGQRIDLGSLGGTYCYAGDVNPSGTMIVGGGWTVPYQPFGANTRHAFLYTNGAMTDLGTFGGPNSGAAGISSFGDFVGFADVSSGADHAFIDKNNQMMDLNSMVDGSAAGWTLSVAVDINDSGRISGYGIAPNGNTHAFLLTPLPEPSLVGILGLFASIICGTARVR